MSDMKDLRRIETQSNEIERLRTKVHRLTQMLDANDAKWANAVADIQRLTEERDVARRYANQLETDRDFPTPQEPSRCPTCGSDDRGRRDRFVLSYPDLYGLTDIAPGTELTCMNRTWHVLTPQEGTR